MSRINAAALGAALLIGFAGVAGAQATGTQPPGAKAPNDRRGPGLEGRRGFGRGFGRGFARGFGGSLAKDLNLTDAQKAQIKTIHEKYRPQLEAIRSQLKPQVDNARALRATGDTAGARAAFEKARVDIRQRMLTIRQQEQGEIRNILTPEQRTKFDAAQAQRKKWMDEHAKGGRGHGRLGRGARPQRG
ncbi:MAG TPA: Spy/CpxP family protein refolding chaperone [Gemmatimonadaceae bacterium]|jgi:Spy/CpxP family protein refolding chaperone